VMNAQIWFWTPQHALARSLYGNDPLPEAEMVAQFIRANSTPDARVAVLGSEPEIYFLSRRHSATGYIYIYALAEAQPFALKMQREMTGDIEAQKPEFIVLSTSDRLAASRPDSFPNLFDWWDDYKTNYTRVGLTDIISPTQTACAFGINEVARYGTIHHHALEIFERKAGDSNPVKTADKL